MIMTADRFIAGKLRFKGRMATIAIAVSFFVIIISVSISSGFKKEIGKGLSELAGDLQLFESFDGRYSSQEAMVADEDLLAEISSLPQVRETVPVIYRPAIIKAGDSLHGVLFKGVPSSDSTALSAEIPVRLSEIMGLSEGDTMLSYFVGEKVKARKFKVTRVYDALVDASDKLVVKVGIDDLRRLNGWNAGECSLLEVNLVSGASDTGGMRRAADELAAGTGLICLPLQERYPNLYDWLALIDSNVLAILVLMTIVAGFNMISGLLIMLFRSTSTIGVLKTMGMRDSMIASLFLRLSARAAALGMLAGNVLALLFCLVQGTTKLIRLNPVNYFVSFVPVSVNIPMILLSDAVAFAAILLLMLIPTLFISGVDPARTVRVR